MSGFPIIKGIAFEDGGAVNLARVTNYTGSNVTQASLTSIHYSVYDLTSSTLTVSSTSLTVSGVVYDTLQTSAIWTLDSTGYNFLHVLPASALPDGDHVYRVDYKFTPSSGEVFWQPFEITTLPIYVS